MTAKSHCQECTVTPATTSPLTFTHWGVKLTFNSAKTYNQRDTAF